MRDAPSDEFGFVREFVDDPPLLIMTGGVSADAPSDARIALEPGLSDEEVERVQQRFRFRFPPDLRALLCTALPVSSRFPNWRSALDDDLDTLLDWPADGICFDIQHGNFWLEAWGPRPFDTDEACTVAREHIAHAPTLIPIFGHRYIPDEPAEAGNPVFSIHQSDIIHYGRDLPDYINRELRPRVGAHAPVSGARPIRFWTDLL
jgi:hypothetical protein